MTQHPGFQCAHDVRRKVERELARLEAEVTSDTFFNFAVTAYHLCDWIAKDATLPKEARRQLATVRKQLPIQICRDIANGSKHFGVNYKDFVVADATCVAGYGIGRYGAGSYGVGEASIEVTLADGELLDGLNVARQATTVWQEFFAKYAAASGD